MSDPLTDEDLSGLLDSADHAETFRAEDDGFEYEKYGKASEIDPEWWVCLEPERARSLVAEVRRLREQNERLVNICVKHGIPIPAEMLALIQALTRAGEQEP